jgi:hypothetical protein
MPFNTWTCRIIDHRRYLHSRLRADVHRADQARAGDAGRRGGDAADLTKDGACCFDGLYGIWCLGLPGTQRVEKDRRLEDGEGCRDLTPKRCVGVSLGHQWPLLRVRPCKKKKKTHHPGCPPSHHHCIHSKEARHLT